jgi:HAD superfamily hydrolase (TIGR01509 family)
MRMPEIRAVLFDYGRTLVTFAYPVDELRAVVERFRPAIAEAIGAPAPAADGIVQKVLLPLEALVENTSEDEIEYLQVFGAAWRRAGIELPDALLYDILDAEQLVWDGAARLDPNALQVLSWLGERGLRRAICSNAPFPPEMMLRQVRTNGIAALVEAIVFSSQVGRRKPAREMYVSALNAIGVAAQDVLFVGDRVREDYEGPRAVGMRAVICTAHATAGPGDGIPTIASLKDLPAIL